MENSSNEQEVAPSLSEVYELPGEPAIVINGMPEIPSSDSTALALSSSGQDAESLGNTNFGQWLEGREVRKLFGEQYYSGTVTEYDKETGWYRVVYEDGDFEDLDWTELEQVLLPVDIMVPLKTLALKTLRKSKKPIRKSRNVMVRSRTHKAKTTGIKGKMTSVQEDASMLNVKVPEEAPKVNSNVPEDDPKLNLTVPEDDPKLNSSVPEDDPKLNSNVPEDDPKLNSNVPEDDPKLNSNVPEDAVMMDSIA